jgi:mannose-1-phosphate guanylyltransferase
LHAVDIYRTTAQEEDNALTDFIVVRAGDPWSDLGSYEAIVPVADATLQKAAQEVKNKLPASKKRAAHK